MRVGYSLQSGFAVIAAVVLIVVFALIGAFMLTTTSNQNMTTALSHREIQAWFAAQSGIERAMRHVSTPSGCVAPGSCTAGPVCTAIGAASPLSLASHAVGYNVVLGCTCTCVADGGPDYAIYRVTATATSGSASDPAYVSRTVQATARE